MLCLLNDYELLIFFIKLFVSILWGPGWWWVLPVGIYVCLGCAWDHYQFLTFSWIIQVVWICKSSWGLSVITTHQGNSFPLFLLSLGQELWDLFLNYSYTKGSSFYQSSGIWVSYLIPQVGSGLWLLFFHISWGHGNQGWDWWGLANALSVLFTSGFLHSPRVRLNNFFLTFLWCF